jgi:4-hydroxybenzoyl-CoA reductase subunit beta
MDLLPDFDYLRPNSVETAAATAAEHPDGMFVAGGTDLMANIRRGLGTPDSLIDLSRIESMRHIEFGGDGLTIGAAVTLTELASDERVKADYPIISEAAESVAGPSHRNAATVGGNLCQDTRCVYYNQSHWWRKANDYCLKYEGTVCHVAKGGDKCWAAFCSDLAPALLVHRAEVDIAGSSGVRRVPLPDLYFDEGRAHLRLEAGEFVAAVHLPTADTHLKTGYEKSRVRGSIEFPLAGVAIALSRDGDVLTSLRIALTGTNCCPVVVGDAGSLVGKPLDDGALDELGRMVKARIQPMSSTFTSHQYRRRVAVNLATRLARDLYSR